jgi:hypothetical protein
VVDTATRDRATDRIQQHPGGLAPIERDSRWVSTAVGEVTESSGQPQIQAADRGLAPAADRVADAGSPTSNKVRRRSRLCDGVAGQQTTAGHDFAVIRRPGGDRDRDAAFRGPQGVRVRSVSTGVSALGWCQAAVRPTRTGKPGSQTVLRCLASRARAGVVQPLVITHSAARVSIPRAIRAARSTSRGGVRSAAVVAAPRRHGRGARGGSGFRVEAAGHRGVVSSHWPPRGNSGVPGSCRVQLTGMMSMPMRPAPRRIVASPR